MGQGWGSGIFESIVWALVIVAAVCSGLGMALGFYMGWH